MPRYRVLPYRQGSRSAAALAEALGGRVLRLQGSTFRSRPDDVIVNWGCTAPEHPTYYYPVGARFNCDQPRLRQVTNKLEFFRMMERTGNEEIIPPFYTRTQDIPDDAFPIVCRTQLAGHSGAGIVIANSRADLVPASLYVKYVKKQEEYRIHVGRRGEAVQVISVQRKARRTDAHDDEVNWQVRNHNNGFVFIRGGVNPPDSVIEVSKRSLQASGLDFGAVDVIFNERQQRAYVLEINTAPGLEGQTVSDYATFFRN